MEALRYILIRVLCNRITDNATKPLLLGYTYSAGFNLPYYINAKILSLI